MIRFRKLVGTGVSLAIALFLQLPAMANGLYENRPWQFETSADKANKAFLADMIERKKGGFYDAFGPANNTFYNMDCYISAEANGNVSTEDVTASTSSPDVSPGSGHTSSATGSEALNAGGGGGPLNNTQSNSGSQSSNIYDNTSTVGSVDASGGTTIQTLNTTQDNLGNQTAEVNDSIACNFSQGGN